MPGGAHDRVGLRHVAELAGVSVKNASNVVNGYVNVTDRTRTRVLQAIEQLHYRANLAARGLRQGRSGVIAVAAPEIGCP